MKKITKILSGCIGAIGFMVMGIEGEKGQPTWLNLAGIGIFTVGALMYDYFEKKYCSEEEIREHNRA